MTEQTQIVLHHAKINFKTMENVRHYPLDIRGNDIFKCVQSCGENGGEKIPFRCKWQSN